jgi:hypothetical protein
VCRVLSLASQAGASAHNGWLIKTSLQVAQSLKSASGAQRQASSAVMSGGRTSYLRVTQVGALPMVTRSCQWPKLVMARRSLLFASLALADSLADTMLPTGST